MKNTKEDAYWVPDSEEEQLNLEKTMEEEDFGDDYNAFRTALDETRDFRDENTDDTPLAKQAKSSDTKKTNAPSTSGKQFEMKPSTTT